MDSSYRPANMPKHRTKRPTRHAAGQVSYLNEEDLKVHYIEFINQLMYRMQMDSIDRMLDTALKQMDIA